MLARCIAERTAGHAVVALVVEIDVSHADGRLEVPAAAQNPRIAVGDTHAGAPTLVTVIARGLDERNVHRTYIIFAVSGMHAEEMALETFAQPITEFGLDNEVTHLAVVALVERPGVVSARDIERRLLAEAELESGIGRRGGPIEQVGLDGHLLHARCRLRLLSACRMETAAHGRKDENGQNFFHISTSLETHQAQASGLEERLLAFIQEKDVVIREQAEEIGQLRERVAQMQQRFEKDAANASTDTIANVG